MSVEGALVASNFKNAFPIQIDQSTISSDSISLDRCAFLHSAGTLKLSESRMTVQSDTSDARSETSDDSDKTSGLLSLRSMDTASFSLIMANADVDEMNEHELRNLVRKAEALQEQNVKLKRELKKSRVEANEVYQVKGSLVREVQALTDNFDRLKKLEAEQQQEIRKWKGQAEGEKQCNDQLRANLKMAQERVILLDDMNATLGTKVAKMTKESLSLSDTVNLLMAESSALKEEGGNLRKKNQNAMEKQADVEEALEKMTEKAEAAARDNALANARITELKDILQRMRMHEKAARIEKESSDKAKASLEARLKAAEDELKATRDQNTHLKVTLQYTALQLPAIVDDQGGNIACEKSPTALTGSPLGGEVKGSNPDVADLKVEGDIGKVVNWVRLTQLDNAKLQDGMMKLRTENDALKEVEMNLRLKLERQHEH